MPSKTRISPQETSQPASQPSKQPHLKPAKPKPIDEDLAIRLSGTNGRLKAGHIGLEVEVIKNRFYLRGILPSKQGKDYPAKQQRISTGIRANISNLSAAERLARKISVQLADQSFLWDDYIRAKPKQPDPQTLTVSEWVARLESRYKATRKKSSERDATWEKDYLRVYRDFPQHELLTPHICMEIVEKTEAGSRLRDRYVNAIQMLSKFAGVAVDLSDYRCKSQDRRIDRRKLPTDEEIAQWFEVLHEQDPQWAYVYGLLACYGLRTSEVWYVDLESLKAAEPLLRIWDGKTSQRLGIMPLYPEWFERWKLGDPRMPTLTTNKDPSAPVTRHFRKLQIPFTPYALRHAWAGRASAHGIDVGSAANQMGHSVKVHQEYYGHWYTEAHQRKVYQYMLTAPHRPLAP